MVNACVEPWHLVDRERTSLVLFEWTYEREANIMCHALAVLGTSGAAFGWPVFQWLCDQALLKRCSDEMTQNAMECLHSVIWG